MKRVGYAITTPQKPKVCFAFRFQLALVGTLLLLHALFSFIILFEVHTIWQQSPTDKSRLVWGLTIGLWDFAIFLISLACLRVIHATRKLYNFELRIMVCSWGPNILANLSFVTLQVRQASWDVFVWQILCSAAKRDIATAMILFLSGFTILLGSIALVTHFCLCKRFDYAQTGYRLHYQDVKPSSSRKAALSLDSFDLRPYPYSNRRVHELQKTGPMSPTSPYANSTVQPLELKPLKNFYGPLAANRGIPQSPMHAAVIDELKTTLPQTSIDSGFTMFAPADV